MKTTRELEMERLYDAVNSIADEQRMLFVCLTGADPKDACRMTYEPFEAIGSRFRKLQEFRDGSISSIAGMNLTSSLRSDCVLPSNPFSDP